MNVLIAEPLAAAGIELFRSQPGWNVIVSTPKEYAQHLAQADALLVRSAVQVDDGVLAKAPQLRVIGRAGGGARPLNVTVQVSTPDAESFRRSEAQVSAAIARAVARGGRAL